MLILSLLLLLFFFLLFSCVHKHQNRYLNEIKNTARQKNKERERKKEEENIYKRKKFINHQSHALTYRIRDVHRWDRIVFVKIVA